MTHHLRSYLLLFNALLQNSVHGKTSFGSDRVLYEFTIHIHIASVGVQQEREGARLEVW